MRARLFLLLLSRVIKLSLIAINRSSFIYLMAYIINFSAFNNKIYLVLVIDIVISRCL